LEPIGSGGTASISHWIETEGGELVEVLSASIMDVNITTDVQESWDPTGIGDYVFVVEIKDGEGNPIAEYSYPFQVGVVGVSILDISLTPEILGSSNDLTVSMTIKNIGNITLEGNHSIFLYDPEMRSIDEVFVDVTMGPGEEVIAGTEFDLSGTNAPYYFVRGSFNSALASDALMVTVLRIEEEIETPVIYSLILDFIPLPENLTEGDDIWINGTVTRNDTVPIPGVDIRMKIGDYAYIHPQDTDQNGTFSIFFESLDPGDYTWIVQALVGDWSAERTIQFYVNPMVSDDDDVSDDDIVDDDDVVDDDVTDDDVVDDDVVDDDITDDDVTDDDAVDDDDEDKIIWPLIGGIIVGIILLLLGILFIIIMARRFREEEMDWDEE
jgi:hypothetical protein